MSALQAPANGLADRSLDQRLNRFLSERTGAHVSVSELKRYPVGFSWITYGFCASIDGASHDLILRLGPENGLYAPYSARPQFEALRALHGSAVPVPEAWWMSDDPAILGDPFFVCSRSPGEAPIPWVTSKTAAFADSYRVPLGHQFVDALAAIHTHDWRNGPLNDGCTDLNLQNVASVEVERWARLHERWKLRPFPMIHWALNWLRANLPVAPAISIIHGDYRLGNFLERDGQITAILDWELVHLGDPHEDIGWACLPQYEGGSGLVCRLIGRDEFFRRYERATGIAVDPTSLRFYTVLSLLKLALTHMAAVRCFEDGRVDDIRLPAMGTQIIPVLRQIEKIVDAAP
jgi:aminoglycoside phosphotransferase (APT) family kinase protein